MNRYDGDQTSIFPRPSEDEPDRGAPPPAAEPPQPPDQPIRAHPAPEFDPAERTRHEGLSRQVIVLGSMGLAILALSGFIGVSLLRSDADPAAAAVPSPSV